MSDNERTLPGRREFMVRSLSVVAASSLACSSDDAKPAADDTGAPGWSSLAMDETLFAHGVASGDPLADRVILWTRPTAENDADLELRWVVSRDAALTDVVVEGKATASSDHDFTVKVDAVGLSAETTYYYAFAIGSKRSIVGRTRTLPKVGVARVRLAYTSCANFNNGYFHAYENIAKRADLDAWIHLGDYIYEYADGVYGDPDLGRVNDPVHETITLSDYRTRYAQYRREPVLRELHRQLPCIVIWDDHEFANNANKDGAENHDPQTEGSWDERKHVAAQAFLEWLPIRVAESPDVPKIYRSFAFGDLFDLIMLDTRLIGRDKQAGYDDAATGRGDPAVWSDPTRQILGAEQEAWFKAALSASNDRGATYRLIGNQIIFSPTRDPQDLDAPLYVDFWDGYKPARDRIADHILDNGIHDVVFLTGDIHTSWAIEIAKDPFDDAVYDPATSVGAYAVEFVGPSVTSQALEDDSATASIAPTLISAANPQVKYSEVTRKGYVLLDVSPDVVTAEWYYVKNHKLDTEAAAEETLAKAFAVDHGTSHLREVSEATRAKSSAPLAP